MLVHASVLVLVRKIILTDSLCIYNKLQSEDRFHISFAFSVIIDSVVMT